jgi:hypothetical protein
METYDNAYKKEEDELLWEIHEIRNDIHSSKSYDDLNSLNKKSIEIHAQEHAPINGSRLKWLLY